MNDDFNAPQIGEPQIGEPQSDDGAVGADDNKGKKSGTSVNIALFCVTVALISVILSVCFSLAAIRIYEKNREERRSAEQGGSFSDLVNGATSANRSVVAISVFNENDERIGSGSGVIWSADGYIVTCDHVANKGALLVVTLPDGTRYEASLVGNDFKTDLAVIRIETSNALTPAGVSEKSVSLGQRIIAIGNSLGSYSNTVTDGVISAETRRINVEGRDMELIQMSAAVNPGNSGGGLFDGNGGLIGIVNAKASSESMEGIGFAIPISSAVPVIEEIISNGFVAGRPTVSFESVYISYANYLSYPELARFYTGYGWLGSSIIEGEYVTDAGDTALAVGDRIVSVNGTEVDEHSDMVFAVQSSSPGESLTLGIYRDDFLNVEVPVTEKTNKQSEKAGKYV